MRLEVEGWPGDLRFPRCALGALPSPLWGGVGGGGREIRALSVRHALPPSPALPHKGGGSTLRLPPAHRTTFPDGAALAIFSHNSERNCFAPAYDRCRLQCNPFGVSSASAVD